MRLSPSVAAAICILCLPAWISQAAPDAFEPDSLFSSARKLSNGQTQNHTLHAPGDTDWATFTVLGLGARNFRLTTSGSTTSDTQVWLYKGNSLLAYDDDSGGGKYSAIADDWLNPGTYHIKVQEYGNDGTIPAYRLRAIWTTVLVAPDVYEGDNSPAAATRIANGQKHHHSIHRSHDVDWSVFTIGGNGARNLRIETAGTVGDTAMWLFTEAGTLVANDNSSGRGNFSRISLNYLSPGTYRIKVRESGGDAVIRYYALRPVWTTIPIPADAFESDNISATGKTISNGRTQTRSIHTAGDTDWATFTVRGAGPRNLRIETAGARGDTQLWLYRQNSDGTGAGRSIAYNNNGGAGNFSRITYPSLPAGTYYIKVREYGNNGLLQSYTLRAVWTTATMTDDAYESDGSWSSAKTIANGRAQSRSIHMAGDVDIAKFTVGNAGARSVRIETSGASGDTQLSLYSSARRLIAYNDNGGAGNFSRITRTSLSPGTYYIKVKEYGNNGAIPAYQLRATWNATFDSRFPAEIDGPIKWLHTDVSNWPVTARMTASVADGKISFPYNKSSVWPGAEIPGGGTGNGNPWVIVKWTDGKWYAATFEWLRVGQTWKPVGVLDGSKGDHIKKSPLSGWRPHRGERFGIMVSGLARDSRRNVQERSNVDMVTWPY